MGDAPPRYSMRTQMMARLSRGGYMRVYTILDREDVIGTKSVTCPKRGEREIIRYVLGASIAPLPDAPTFTTAKDFIAAYEAKLTGATNG